MQIGSTSAATHRAGIAPRRFGFLHIAAFFALWAAVICVRLFWLQVIDHREYLEKAARQQQRTFEVAPRRGILYDRNLHELAMTVLADSVYAVPSEMADRQDPDAQRKYQAAAAALAGVVHTDASDRFTSPRQIAARLSASRNFAWIARKLDSATAARVTALHLNGIYLQKEFKRYYPNNQLAAQTLGYVGMDDNGLGGLEKSFDPDLHGVPGRMLTALDARRQVLGSQEREPDPGKNLVLTLDENIQFMAERSLDAALARTHARSGTVVVQDPESGQILALAVRPTYDPNRFRHATGDLLRNNAISDVFEPGSTFKLVTYSSAIEKKLTNPNEVIDCEGGKITLAGRVIHDDHYNGLLTVAQALQESSDVAAIKLALRVGPDDFYGFIRAFGFGSRSGIRLPAETRGLLRPVRRWSGSSIGSIAIGQEVAVTPIQLVTMVSTIANGGMYLPPKIVLEETGDAPEHGLNPSAFHPEGELPDPLPEGAHRVVTTMTAAIMRQLAEGVVLHGTGTTAQLNGYSAGGKTGTAQKIDVLTHRYSKTDYVASFVGFAPVNNPAVTIAVVIDSPRGDHFGRGVSAPVFQELAQEVLEYLGVPHDQPVRDPAPAAKEEARQDPGDQERAPPQETGDLNALFASVNDLPPDDPLRTQAEGRDPAPAAGRAAVEAGVPAASLGKAAESLPPVAEANPPADRPAPTAKSSPEPPSGALPPAALSGAIAVDAQRRVSVPSFAGEPVRQAVEAAGMAGLSLQVLGSGLATAQVPAPGALVPLGTAVVVRFAR